MNDAAHGGGNTRRRVASAAVAWFSTPFPQPGQNRPSKRRLSMSIAESGHDVSGFRLTVSLAKSVFAAGEPVWMTVEFRNVSGRELPYGAQA
jgi:hypothetical protein